MFDFGMQDEKKEDDYGNVKKDALKELIKKMYELMMKDDSSMEKDVSQEPEVMGEEEELEENPEDITANSSITKDSKGMAENESEADLKSQLEEYMKETKNKKPMKALSVSLMSAKPMAKKKGIMRG